MRYERLTESKPEILELQSHQAEALNRIGRRLASDRRWWGDQDGETKPDRRVIRCSPRGPGKYQVRVADAVGVIAIGDLQIHVQPKIPPAHLLYLFAASGRLPRLDEQKAAIAAGEDLHSLIAQWFVDTAEGVLRRDLIKDYSPHREFLRAKRGRIHAVTTARAYYSGRVGFDCEFDEFNTDTALNRVLRGAARAVTRRPELERTLRKRASRLVARMDEVGRLRHRDMAARVDRRTLHYRDAITLGRQVIRWQGRFLEQGVESAWTFLIRTPEMVEEGLRNILRESLGDTWFIEKQKRRLAGSSLSFSPDLVIDGGRVVGDVKYKIRSPDWRRSDLYQIVAFAEAFGSEQGVVIDFATAGTRPLPQAQVGRIDVRSVSWPADPQIPSVEASAVLVREVRRLLQP